MERTYLLRGAWTLRDVSKPRKACIFKTNVIKIDAGNLSLIIRHQNKCIGEINSSSSSCRSSSSSSSSSSVVVVVVVVVIGQTVGSISSRTLAYDCLCTLELCTASLIATS